MIKVEQINKYFFKKRKNEIHVLNDITLDLPEKGLIVLLGASGSGKTTLLNVLGGLDKIDSGTINFEDEKITGYPSHKWDLIRNEKIGYIFQNYNLLPELSIYDNIAFVLNMIGIKNPDEVKNRVHYILNAVGMYPFRKKKATQLSGGQMQRVAIARALVKNPKIIIADEPTGNLDSKNTVEIMNIIKEISKTKLVVLVTHEKNLANVYGDRIITLTDGKIIDDKINLHEGNLIDNVDQTIYLKDLNLIESNKKENLEMSLYSDLEDVSQIKVRLIYRNKTLYLDVDSDIEKIKLIDEASQIIVKDEKYRQKSKEELMETSFDLNTLDHSNIKKEYKMLTSIKQTIKMALYKVLKTSRKGKLMLFSFFTAGAVLAFALAMLFAVVLLKPENFTTYSEGHIQVIGNSPTNSSYSDFINQFSEYDDFEILPMKRAVFSFVLPENQGLPEVYSNLELNNISKKDLIAGRLGTNINEIVISKGIADSLLNNRLSQEMGLRSYQHLFYETLSYNGSEFKIVGVQSAESTTIFVEKEVLYLDDFQFFQMLPLQEYKYLPSAFIQTTKGVLPTANNQIVMSEVAYDLLFSTAWTGPVNFPGNPNYQIVGLHNNVDYPITLFLTTEKVEEIFYNSLQNQFGGFIVYSSSYKKITEKLESQNYTVNNFYLDALDTLKQTRSDSLATILPVTALLIGFAAVGFYFVIRSSLISRIYEVSVYRALGIKKKEIFTSFIVEIFVMTTLSTLIGFIVANMLISTLNDSIFGMFDLFAINPFTIFIGLILVYALNLLAGLLPVQLLLAKTPAQILAQYDI